MIRTSVEQHSKTAVLEDKPDWITKSRWLHWDMNPFHWTTTGEGLDYEFNDFITENNGTKNTGEIKVQGMINLVDAREQDGGYVP